MFAAMLMVAAFRMEEAFLSRNRTCDLPNNISG